MKRFKIIVSRNFIISTYYINASNEKEALEKWKLKGYSYDNNT